MLCVKLSAEYGRFEYQAPVGNGTKTGVIVYFPIRSYGRVKLGLP